MFQISFLGYKPITNNVDIDFYTGKFVPIKRRSIEHILPKSKGGKNNVRNYAMSDMLINSERGNMSMGDWLNIHPNFLQNMKNYVRKYFNFKIDNINHGEEVAKTVKEKYNIDLLG